MFMQIKKWQKGVGLIEIMIAAVILSIGLIALARLYSGIMVSGNEASQRSVAMTIAEKKIEDLQGFEQSTGSGADGVFGYDEIGNNTGGKELNDGTLVLPANTALSDISTNTEYTMNWTLDADNSQSKEVTVNIYWQDLTGTTLSTSASGKISRITPSMSASLTLNQNQGSLGPVPKVKYQEGAAPEYVAIDVGSDQYKKETDTPEPIEIKQSGRTIVTFDTVTYDSSDDNTTVRRESFVTVSCRCQYPTNPTSIAGLDTDIYPTLSGTYTGGYTPTIRSVYADDVVGDLVVKPVGVQVATTGESTALCDLCCRDHHDSSSGNYISYDPWRDAADYYSGADSATISGALLLEGDHKHYKSDGTLAGVGDEYIESCRFRRVEGFLRTAPDWRLLALNIIPTDNLNSESEVDTYGNYVRDVVEGYVQQTLEDYYVGQYYPRETPIAAPVYDISGTSQSYPFSQVNKYFTSFGDAYNESLGLDDILDVPSLSASFITIPTTNKPISLAFSSTDVANDETADFIARSVYVDYLDIDEVLSTLNISGADTIATGTDGTSGMTAYRSLLEATLPFYEVNVTNLVDFSGGDDSEDNVFDVATTTVSDVSVGQITLIGSGIENVRARMEWSNSGISKSPYAVDGMTINNATGTAILDDARQTESKIPIAAAGTIIPDAPIMDVYIYDDGAGGDVALGNLQAAANPLTIVDATYPSSCAGEGNVILTLANGTDVGAIKYRCELPVDDGAGLLQIASYNSALSSTEIQNHGLCWIADETDSNCGSFAPSGQTITPSNYYQLDEKTTVAISGGCSTHDSKLVFIALDEGNGDPATDTLANTDCTTYNTPNVLPTADFTWYDTLSGSGTDCFAGRSCTLDGTASNDNGDSGSIIAYAWDVGDDGSTDGTSTSINWTFSSATLSPVDNPVKLTVTDNSGGSASITQDVDVGAAIAVPPTPTIGALPTCYVANACTFTGSYVAGDNTPVNFDWYFGDGQVGANNNVAPDTSVSPDPHTYTRAGDYTVVLLATDEFGAQGRDSASISVAGLEITSIATSSGEANLAWTGLSNVTAYHCDQRTSPTCDPTTSGGANTDGDNTYLVTNVSRNRTYNFKVCQTDMLTNCSPTLYNVKIINGGVYP